jgi:hypothetical protein
VTETIYALSQVIPASSAGDSPAIRTTCDSRKLTDLAATNSPFRYAGRIIANCTVRARK